MQQELIAFRPLCDLAAELGAANVPAHVRQAFTRDCSELLATARALRSPRWLVRELREQCGRAHVLAYIAASN